MSQLLRTGVLLAAMTAIFLTAGYLIGGGPGALIALGFALVTNALAYWNSDQLVLRQQGAQLVTRQSAPELVAMVEELARRANLPMPATYILDSDQPNAFATGRSPNHAAVAVTRGLMHRLTHEELAGVIAHELAHIRNRDTLTMTVTATIAGALSMLANFGLMFGGNNRNSGPLGAVGVLLVMILAPITAAVVQMAISRSREYAADRDGGQICGNPLWLAAALRKIEAFAQRIENDRAEEHPASAHLFIINPLRGGEGEWGTAARQSRDRLFATHPNTGNRVAELERQARAMAGALRQVRAGDQPFQRQPVSGPWG